MCSTPRSPIFPPRVADSDVSDAVSGVHLPAIHSTMPVPTNQPPFSNSNDSTTLTSAERSAAQQRGRSFLDNVSNFESKLERAILVRNELESYYKDNNSRDPNFNFHDWIPHINASELRLLLSFLDFNAARNLTITQ